MKAAPVVVAAGAEEREVLALAVGVAEPEGTGPDELAGREVGAELPGAEVPGTEVAGAELPGAELPEGTRLPQSCCWSASAAAIWSGQLVWIC